MAQHKEFLFENTSAEINNAPAKATPVGADEIGIWDSATGLLKGLTWTNLLATAKAYFDTLYITTAYSPVPTRQTVLSGPTVASGAAIVPNFLAATYASLVVTTQNVGAGLNQLIATASSGDADVNGRSAANLTWPVCTANQTNYLFCNVSGGALIPVAPTILPPIYQDGGTPSVVNGQYTYNKKEHTMYLGNGTTAPAVNHVEFARVVAGAATITATVAYAYQGYYDSGYAATLPVVATSKNHNIGTDNVVFRYIAEVLVAEGGYTIGDEIEDFFTSDPVAVGLSLIGNYKTSLACGIPPVNAGQIYFKNKTTGTAYLATLANYQWKFKAQRDWN